MADPGIFRINPLQSWQRDAVLKAAQMLQERFGNPPVDAQARAAHDGLLEVLDPARRTVRLQKELSEATRKALTERPVRRARDRRTQDRRSANLGSPSGSPERRKGERRRGERRNRK